ncbi:MAG TPA: ATP-binding protein [Urbifossiella sp.]|jgi:signal transduction histidine kinase|nr:ATP-binding protein [Urbifossiella sp.]
MTLNRQVLFQVTMPALLVALAMLGTSLLGIRSINHLQADQDKIVSEHVRSLQAAQDLETELRHIRFHSFIYVMDPIGSRWDKVARDQTAFERLLGEIRDRAGSDEERRVIAAIEAGYNRYQQELRAAAAAPVGPTKADCLSWADAHPIRFIVDPCEQLLELNRRSMRETVEASGRKGGQARSWMILLGVIGAAGGLVGGFGVAWGLSRSITRLSVRLRDVHAHLDQEVGSVRLTAEGGNLQRMERQVGTILERVREVVGQLQRQECEALRAEQLAAVGQLAASIAHEVRNPLTSVKLLVGAALSGHCPRGLSQTDLQVIHDEVGRLERKVQSLLDFARPLEFDPEPQDIAGVVRQVIDLVGERLRGQAVRLTLDLPPGPLAVELDADQFKGVLVNLVFNALDVMPGGGGLDVRLARAAGGAVRLTVEDTGPGIDARVADRLFTPFFSTKPTGTGLGLSVSRRIVQAHGGTLTAANRPDGGACFTITLPGGGNQKAEDRGQRAEGGGQEPTRLAASSGL